MSTPPDIRPYLEVRTAAPRNWSPDDSAVLVSSDVPGTAQLHRLDLDRTPLPIDAAELARITAFEEPADGAYLEDDPAGGEHRVLVVSDRGATNDTSSTAPAIGRAYPCATRRISSRSSSTTTTSIDPERSPGTGGCSRTRRTARTASRSTRG